MAKKNKAITFKNCQISIVDDTITEFTKNDGVKVYSLSEILDVFSEDDQFIDVTIRENYELTPISEEG